MEANTPDLLAGACSDALNVGSSFDIAAPSNGVLFIVLDIEIDANRPKSVRQARDGTVTTTTDLVFDAINRNHSIKDPPKVPGVLSLARLRRCRRGGPVRGDGVIDDLEPSVLDQGICMLEELGDLSREQFTTLPLGHILDNLAEGDLQTAREIKVKLLLDNPGSTTLSTLGVHTDNGLVITTDILGIERQIWNLPVLVVGFALLFAEVEALLDGILV